MVLGLGHNGPDYFRGHRADASGAPHDDGAHRDFALDLCREHLGEQNQKLVVLGRIAWDGVWLERRQLFQKMRCKSRTIVETVPQE